MAENEHSSNLVTPYTANRDMMDALRIEISSNTSKQQEGLKEAMQIITDKIVTDYGRFMPHTTLDLAKTIDERTLLINRDGFHPFYKNWPSSNESSFDAEGAMFHEGSISVVQDFVSQKENAFNITDEESKQRFIELSKGDEEEARIHLAEMNFGSHLAHETLHQLHAKGLPTYFVESANLYYQREIENELPMYTFLPGDSNILAANFYQEVIEKFGDEGHKVFFGTQEDNELAMRIKAYLFYYLWHAREQGLYLDNIFQDKPKNDI